MARLFAHLTAHQVARLVAFTLAVTLGAAARADVALLLPVADTTLYAPTTSGNTNANGSGVYLFAGNTADNEPRRSLLRFDLSPLPPGAVVTSATLTLTQSRGRGASATMTLHRVTRTWTEGMSNAGEPGGMGATPMPGDATWLHASFNTQFWTTPGGDFAAAASASALVADTDGQHDWSGAGMVADVAAWLANPATNFGWLLRGNEATVQTARRFQSREYSALAQRPTLRLVYTVAGTTGACCLPSGSCANTTQATCTAAGGVYQGDGSTCADSPCPPPTGACCMPDGSCFTDSMGNCMMVGGTYRGDGVACADANCPITLEPYVDALPIPGVLAPTTGTSGGSAHYDVAATEQLQRFHRDLPLTRVWGYAGSYPGPSIEAHTGQPVTVTWINDLRVAETGALRTTHALPVDICLHGPDMTGQSPVVVTHLHGGHVAQDSDGDPETAFPPGQQSTLYTYPNAQRAATLWYHDHALGITRLNVYMGLAGFYLLRDAQEDALVLPRGAYEIPLAIQDRSFNPDGSLRYPAEWHEHFFGDFITVNGKVAPFLNVDRGKYRFRVLNGSGSRAFLLGLSNGAEFYQIGSDQGLLPAPVPMNAITLLPGERADLVFDFSFYPNGSELYLFNGAPSPFPNGGMGPDLFDVMKFVVGSHTGHTAPLPASLVPVLPIPEAESVRQRDLQLILAPHIHDPGDPNHEMCHEHTSQMWSIDGLGWDDITEFPRLGTAEVWAWVNRSPISHPMHMHLGAVQILDRQTYTLVSGVVTPTGPRVAPDPNEQGWKDTVQCPPGTITRVITRFEDYEGRFPYHCHILEHEDHEMMRQFQTVCEPPYCCPCPADFDRSGGTPDATDIAVYFDAWLLGDPMADADCSGGTPDSSDIAAFFAAWLAGGC